MNLSRKIAAILVTLFASIPVSDAFSATPPPVKTVVAPTVGTIQQSALVGTVSNFPSHRILLEKSTLSSFSTSTINLAATTATPATTPAPASKAPSATSNAAKSIAVMIIDVNFDGKVPTTEADEYVVISNGTKNPIDVSGFYLYVATTGTQGPTFTFPKGSTIQPGKSIRVYTNEIHKETGGFSFGSGKALWNNKGGLAVLRDAKGGKLSEFKYSP